MAIASEAVEEELAVGAWAEEPLVVHYEHAPPEFAGVVVYEVAADMAVVVAVPLAVLPAAVPFELVAAAAALSLFSCQYS